MWWLWMGVCCCCVYVCGAHIFPTHFFSSLFLFLFYFFLVLGSSMANVLLNKPFCAHMVWAFADAENQIGCKPYVCKYDFVWSVFRSFFFAGARAFSIVSQNGTFHLVGVSVRLSIWINNRKTEKRAEEIKRTNKTHNLGKIGTPVYARSTSTRYMCNLLSPVVVVCVYRFSTFGSGVGFDCGA